VGEHFERVASGAVHFIRRDKVFRKVEVLPFKMSSHRVRGVLVERQGNAFAAASKLEIACAERNSKLIHRCRAACAW